MTHTHASDASNPRHIEDPCPTSIDRTRARDAFLQYVDDYDASNPRIALKIAHTLRVAELCDRIAPAEHDLAWLCGLLHDIGRFEQVRQYNTFNDSLSVSHASLGVDVLFASDVMGGKLIRQFLPEATHDELIRTAVATHSDLRIPANIDDRTRMHCNVLRDADKIDIIKVNCICPMEDIYGVSEDEMVHSTLSNEVVKGFYAHHTIERGVRKTIADVLVGHICFAWELVYDQSVCIVREQGYLNHMLDRHFADAPTEECFRKMASHMREELSL